jgi:hypothetical protein
MLEAANKEKEYVSWHGASPAPLCQTQEKPLLTSIKYAEYRDIKRQRRLGSIKRIEEN